MLGYYYYASKIRPYLTEPQRASYTLLGFTALVLFLFGFFIYFMTQSTLTARKELKSVRCQQAEAGGRFVGGRGPAAGL